ncbi:MAG: tail fiber domain-containing protein [Caulobacteraceae bacterium]|nr:tail fiber domain-containing protein [Caulobacteraceae bacterium]
MTTSRTFQTNLASTSTASFNGSANVTPGVTGTLPVANGGTNTSTAFTAGSVVFAGTSGTYNQDNANLFWDNTNKRLSLGNTSSTYSLAISKSSNSGSASGYPSFDVGNTLTTQGDGSSTFNFSTISMSSGNDAVRLFFTSTYAAGTWEPAGIITVVSNHPLKFKTNNADRMRITADGEVWIGYTTDNGSYPLQVNGQIFATNATIATSDIKFKENITPLNKGLEIVNKLKPVTFNFKNDTENNFSEYEEVGFIAQDVDRALSTETFAKSIVKASDDTDPNSTMGLANQNLIPILVKAIQEQQAQIKALEQRIINLENK